MAQVLPIAAPDDASSLTPSHLADAREVGRVVATVLLASGMPTQEELARANGALAELGRPALGEHDFDVTSPEELAPMAPVEMRPLLAALLFELAGEDPLRFRMADTY